MNCAMTGQFLTILSIRKARPHTDYLHVGPGVGGDNHGDNTYVIRTHTEVHSPEGGGRGSGEKLLKDNDFQPPGQSPTHTVMYGSPDS